MQIKLLPEPAAEFYENHPDYPIQSGNVGKRAIVIPRGDFRRDYEATVIRDDKEKRTGSEGELVTIFLLDDGRCLTKEELHFQAIIS